METIMQITHIKKIKQFKSYYVVWKPGTADTIHDSARRFKSYYVVWKLDPPVSDDDMNDV